MSEETLLEQLAPVLIGILDIGSSDANDGGRQLAELVNERPAEILLLLAKIGALGVGGFENDIRKLAISSLVRTMFNPILLAHIKLASLVPFESIEEEAKSKIERVWLEGLKSEEDSGIRSVLGAYLAQWAKACSERKRQCLAIPPVLIQLTRSQKPLYRCTAYQVFGNAPILLKQSIKEGSLSLGDFASIYRAGLYDPSVDVQQKALKMLSAVVLMDGVPILGDSDLRTDLLREAFQAVASTSDQDQVDIKLDALGEIAAYKPSAFRELVEDIWTYLLILMAPPKHGQVAYKFTSNPIIDQTHLEWRGLGQLASEMFLELAEAFPQDLNQPTRRHMLEDFVGSQIGAQIAELYTEGDSHDWIVSEEPIDVEDDYYAEEAMTKLSKGIQSYALYEVTLLHAGGLLRIPDWRARYCALNAIQSVLAGSLSLQAVKNDLPSLYSFAEPARKDDHPRVRYVWVHMIGQILDQAKGSLQKMHFLPILAACVGLLRDSCWRVREAAARTLVKLFYRDKTIDFSFFSAPNVIKVVEALYAGFEGSPEFVKIAIMDAMGKLAIFAGEACSSVYRPWIEYLLSQAWNEDPDTTLRLRLEIAGAAIALGTAVGKQTFSADAVRLAELLLACQVETNRDDDVGPDAVVKVWCKLAIVLEADFAPFLPQVMPDLLSIASREPDDDEEDPDDEEEQDLPLSDSMEEKAQALDAISLFLRATGLAFQQWAFPAASVASDATKPRFPPQIRQRALGLFPHLLFSALKNREITGLTVDIDYTFGLHLAPLKSVLEQRHPLSYGTLRACLISFVLILNNIPDPRPTRFWSDFLHRFLIDIDAIVQLTRIRGEERNELAQLYGAEYSQEDMEEVTRAIDQEIQVLAYMLHVLPLFDPFYRDPVLKKRVLQQEREALVLVTEMKSKSNE